MRVLGIDLGTNCGWALLEDEELPVSGTWKLKKPKDPSACRYINFDTYLRDCINEYDLPDIISYELVRRHMGVEAAHIYGGLQAHLEVIAHEYSIPLIGIGVTTIKKHATGSGRATKEQMIAQAVAKFHVSDTIDDNEADALFTAHYLIENPPDTDGTV